MGKSDNIQDLKSIISSLKEEKAEHAQEEN